MATLLGYISALCIPLIIWMSSVFYRICRWLWQIRRIQRAVDKFAVVHRHWLYGHLDIIPERNEKAMMKFLEYTSKSKGAFPFYAGFLPVLSVCHPNTVKVILKTTEPKGFFAATGFGYVFIIPWLGDGLLNSKGNKWFRNRRLLTPGFHFEILKPYIEIYSKCLENMLSTFEKSCQNGESVDIIQPISLCTLNIIKKCAFSLNDMDNSPLGSEEGYLQAVNEISALVVERMVTPMHYFDNIYYLLGKGKRFHQLCSFSHDIADHVIHKRKQHLTAKDNNTTGSRSYVDFLDILLLAKDEDGKGLTDLEIRDEVETFMFEGHDTTASAISWILYNFARHPQIQKQAQREIDDLFKRKSNFTVEWDDLNDIPYVTRCIKESMRLHPPVPFVFRELTKDTELIKGHILPPGTTIEINIYAVHHNPDIWGEDHMTYNPDRFLPDNMSNMNSYAFIPFSAGPRNCIGQVFAMNEIKTTIVRVLHKFNLSVDATHKVEMKPDLVLRAKDGIKLFFEERAN